MIDMRTGMLVKSKAGHDKDQIYLIWKEECAYIYLVDGVHRTLDKPKKKRKTHVQPIGRYYEISDADNVKIKKIIKDYVQERKTGHKEE